MSIVLAKQVSDKIRDIVLAKAKQVLGDKFSVAQRVIENVNWSKAKINREYDIPYLAGSSNDGKTVYIDRRLPEKIKINGEMVDPSRYLAVHEMTENRLMQVLKIPYDAAHQVAECYEKAVLESENHSWKKYEEILDAYVKETESENIQKTPDDLYVKPYDRVKRNRILRHQQIVKWK